MRVRLRHDRLARHIPESRISRNHWAIRIGLSRGRWSEWTTVWIAPERSPAMIVTVNAGGDAASEAADAAVRRLIERFENR